MLQLKPQAPEVHVAVALAGGAGQGEHEVPHDAVLVLLRHCVPQRW